MASSAELAKLEGVYDFEHAGGKFDVHLRSEERFFAPKFQAKATWTCDANGKMEIKWAKYGDYDMQMDAERAEERFFSGSKKGEPSNWRKMKRRREFTVAEKHLMDSEWELEHPGGKFNIEFRADSFNHCEPLPAHGGLNFHC